MVTSPVVVVLVTALVAVTLAYFVRGLSRRIQLFDLPNDRSSHVLPTPRLGGVAIALAALCGYTLGLITGMSDADSIWLWAGAAAVATVGLADDLYGLGPAIKMLGQLSVATAALYYGSAGLGLDLRWACLAVLSIVAFANIFNFMDGSDGLAAGMAVLFATGLFVLRNSEGGGDLAFAAGVTAAAAAGFLVLNWGPASIFMGDTGSLFLGFLLAGLSWQVIAGGVGPLAVALVFLPFAGDAGWTMFRRACRHERLWTAHRSHMYQRLLIAGASHRSVALMYYAWAGLAVQLATSYARGGFAVKAVMLALAAGSVVWMEMFARAREQEGSALAPHRRRLSARSGQPSLQG